MKLGRFDKALEDLEDIRKDHEKGKALFITELDSCGSFEDLKRIMTNHVRVFFDDMNFTFHMTRQSLKLIRDLNRKFEKSRTEKGEISEGIVEQEMQNVIDTVQNYRQERSKEKENKEIMDGKP